MTQTRSSCLTTWLTILLLQGFAQSPHSDYPIQPIDFQEVTLHDGFWKSRVKTVAEITIPYALQKCEETGRINNFIYAAGIKEGHFEGTQGFDDSDVFKILEGAAYSLMIEQDEELRAYVDQVVSYISGAQEDDGYLYTAWTLKANDHMELRCCSYDERGQFVGSKFSHELYNVGHMYEAAVAHFRATGTRDFLNVAVKNADLIYRLCVEEDKKFYPGHQEIEIGLVKLYRVTGDRRYLALAKLFLDRRGRGLRQFGVEKKLQDLDFDAYSQDHKPVIEQDQAVGHSVRAAYMYAAMADIAAIMDDQAYLSASDKIWEDVVSGKIYITGGLGAGRGIEGFDTAYALPNDAYAETCAAIANVYWNHRMFLLHGEAKYIDVLERSLYNGLLAGLDLAGNKFFYPNPLVFDGKESFNQGANCRKGWFDCSCCPSNLARFIPSVGGYVYAQHEDRVYINLFVNSETSFDLSDGKLNIKLETKYPWEGKVRLSIGAKNSVEGALYIRIPGWTGNDPVPSDLYRFTTKPAEETHIMVDGEEVNFKMENGFAILHGDWTDNQVEIHFPMEIRKMESHQKVMANRAKLAVQRGPILFCAEAVDNQGDVLDRLILRDAPFRSVFRPDVLDGVSVLLGGGMHRGNESELTLIPYYAWGHRQVGEMAVWLKE